MPRHLGGGGEGAKAEVEWRKISGGGGVQDETERIGEAEKVEVGSGGVQDGSERVGETGGGGSRKGRGGSTATWQRHKESDKNHETDNENVANVVEITMLKV